MILDKLCASVLLLTASVNAAPITIQNAGFETASLTLVGNGNFSQLVAGSTISGFGGTLPDWTVVSNSSETAAGGVAPSPGGVNWTSTWWSGNNLAYLQSSANGATVSLSQVLGATLLDDTTYTLSALIGNRSFVAGLNYSMQLFAGSTLLASSSALNLSDNTFGSDSLVFNSGANNPLAGQALMVRFSTSSGGSFQEAFFDNVALDAVTSNNGGGSTVPEPSSIALTILGGLGLFAVRATRKG